MQIEHTAIDGRHITLKHDGTIELYSPNIPGHDAVLIDYQQASMLKAMILAEHKLQEAAK